MTELQRYLAEEVAEDHADGIITRREAMRRLGLLGLGAAAATTLLAACGSNNASADGAGAATASAAAAFLALARGDREGAGETLHGLLARRPDLRDVLADDADLEPLL